MQVRAEGGAGGLSRGLGVEPRAGGKLAANPFGLAAPGESGSAVVEFEHPRDLSLLALRRDHHAPGERPVEHFGGQAEVVGAAEDLGGQRARGAYEVTLFSETLEKSREFLETGSKVVITVEATMESDQLKLLARSVGPVEQVVAGAGATGLKIWIEGASAINQIASVLSRAAEQMPKAGRGPVRLCLADHGLPGEVEMDLQQDFPVTPEIKGAVKSLGGVLAVEDF